MPIQLRDEHARARHLDRLPETLSKLEAHLSRMMNGTTPEDESSGKTKDVGIVAKLGRIDDVMGTQHVRELREILDRVDTDFTDTELDSDERLHLKIAIAGIFSNPNSLRETYDRDHATNAFAREGSDRTTLSGLFMGANSNGTAHRVRTHVQYETFSQDEAGDLVAAAEPLRRAILDLADRVGDVTHRYYEEGHHRNSRITGAPRASA